LLSSSDILSIHCFLSPETKGKFNMDAFKMMKKNTILINTSRGPVVNEADLIYALQNKLIFGAGLDVTDPEPMSSDHPLLAMENVCVLPHIGSATIEARDEMSRLAAMNVIEFLQKGIQLNVVKS
jgi:glyoxylate reductase